ncbi:MAG: hypothetical protein ACLUNZ_08945 [Evtepia sp.]
MDAEELFQELMELRGAASSPYVGDAVTFVHQALKDGQRPSCWRASWAP